MKTEKVSDGMNSLEINEVYLAEDFQYLKSKMLQMEELRHTVEEKLQEAMEKDKNNVCLQKKEHIKTVLEQMDELQNELEFELELTHKICDLYETCEKRNTEEILRIRLN